MRAALGTRSVSRRAIRREIGRAGGDVDGPMLIVVGGIHGNEPSGLDAMARVFAHLEEHRVALRGALVGLAGNLAALAAGERFLHEDLNRAWSPERVARLRSAAGDGSSGPEAVEQRELLAALHAALERARGPAYVLDLHTTSARTAPFFILGDTLSNREFARRFPAPIVLGLEEHIRGTLNEYVTSLGHVAVAMEGGQHEDAASVDHHEAAVWLALEVVGCVERAAVPAYAEHAARLQRARTLPPVAEIFYRHRIHEADGFRMDEGWENFDRVARGRRLASDRTGEVRSPADGLLFLPLYQKRGDDGFFLVRAVNPSRLALSAWLRRAGVGKLAAHLPGVRAHPDRKDTLVVDLRIARFFARGIFRLLGYRVSAPHLGKMIVRRRPERRSREGGRRA
jgi:succinylglutamate desuccinylase